MEAADSTKNHALESSNVFNAIFPSPCVRKSIIYHLRYDHELVFLILIH